MIRKIIRSLILREIEHPSVSSAIGERVKTELSHFEGKINFYSRLIDSYRDAFDHYQIEHLALDSEEWLDKVIDRIKRKQLK